MCELQGLRVKLSDCEVLENKLKQLSDELRPVSDAATAEQFTTELDNVISRHGDMSTDIDDRIEQLERMMKGWDDVRAGMEACRQSLDDAELMLTDTDVPQSLQDLQQDSDKLKVSC